MFPLWHCISLPNPFYLFIFARITWSFSWLCFPFSIWLKFLEAVHGYFCLELLCVTIIMSNADNYIITTFFWSICFFSKFLRDPFSVTSLANFSELFTRIPLQYLCLLVAYESYHTPLDCQRADFLPQLLICRKNSHLVLQLLFYFT